MSSSGVSPTGPGHSRAEPEEVSALRASVPNAAHCTCAEIDGEDPQCIMHGLSLAGVAAWTDDECLMRGELDSFTARRLMRRAVNALKPFAEAFVGWEDEPEHRNRHSLWEHPLAMDLTLGDCRRAASAIEARQGEDAEERLHAEHESAGPKDDAQPSPPRNIA